MIKRRQRLPGKRVQELELQLRQLSQATSHAGTVASSSRYSSIKQEELYMIVTDVPALFSSSEISPRRGGYWAHNDYALILAKKNEMS